MQTKNKMAHRLLLGVIRSLFLRLGHDAGAEDRLQRSLRNRIPCLPKSTAVNVSHRSNVAVRSQFRLRLVRSANRKRNPETPFVEGAVYATDL
jgi:hypothetical protein